MIISVLAGIILGFVLALPPGPVAVTSMKLGLEKGRKEGTFFGLGTGVMDFIWGLVAVFATSALLLLVDNFVHEFPLLILFIQVAVVSGIVVYGITHLKPKKEISEKQPLQSLEEKSKFMQFLTHKGPFLLGIAVALANFINPTFLPFLMYVTMNVQKLQIIESTPLAKMGFALGYGFGNFLWIYVLVRVMVYFKPRMSQAFIFKVQKFAGVTLIGFGTFLGYRVLEITKWSEILRLVLAF